jgi:hypothetical protein
VADPLPYTLLSLDRYAKIMGINPVHFQSAFTSSIWPIKGKSCGEIWTRYSWQLGDRVSHYDLAQAIAQAEEQMAEYTNFPVAPMWVHGEEHPFPKTWDKSHVPESKDQSTAGRWATRLTCATFYVNEIGRRAVELNGCSHHRYRASYTTTLTWTTMATSETAKITIPAQ